MEKFLARPPTLEYRCLGGFVRGGELDRWWCARAAIGYSSSFSRRRMTPINRL